jgi:uncharacterized heparinase superfamily protein
VAWGNPFDDPQLEHWEHDLSFFSFLLPLAANDPGRCLTLAATLCRRLEATSAVKWGKRPAFVNSPIALSLRIMALAAVLASNARHESADGEDDRLVVERHIRRSETLLRWTLERHLGYNHLVFGTSALAVTEVARGRRPKSMRLMADELHRRLLTDGFWAERSPTYHIHMLFLAKAMRSLLVGPGAPSDLLDSCIDRMQGALETVVHPDGEIAVFNDAAINDAVHPAVLGWSPSRRDSGISLLRDAGYARLWAPGVSAILDAGPMGPDEVIGHGHADFLSIEVSIDGQRVIVDPGVASISGGRLREWTRSAKSHNGPTYATLEPAEFFGTWRVGRRGRAWFERGNTDVNSMSVTGVCDGYVGREPVRRMASVGRGEVRWTDVARREPGDVVSSTYMVPACWKISAEQDGLLLSHSGAGTVVTWRAPGARLVERISTKVYPQGPLAPVDAVALRFEHLHDKVEFLLRIGSNDQGETSVENGREMG